MDTKKIKEILQRCGLFHIWVNQHSIRIEDSKAIRLLICIRINDQYEQTWHSSIPTHIRCSYYVLIIIINFFIRTYRRNTSIVQL